MKQLTGAQAQRELAGVIKTLESLAYVPRRAAAIAAPDLTRLLQDQFARGVDPYGNPWRPLAASTLAKGRTPPPLTDTTKLRDGTRAATMPGNRAGIRLRIGAPYGYFHQVGFRVGKKRVRPRKIFPDRGMPAAWRKVIEAATKRAFREAR